MLTKKVTSYTDCWNPGFPGRYHPASIRDDSWHLLLAHYVALPDVGVYWRLLGYAFFPLLRG